MDTHGRSAISVHLHSLQLAALFGCRMSLTDDQLATIICAFYATQRQVLKTSDFDTSAKYEPDSFCFRCPMVVDGDSRANTKDLAIARLLDLASLSSIHRTDPGEKSLPTATEDVKGTRFLWDSCGTPYSHFVIWKKATLREVTMAFVSQGDTALGSQDFGICVFRGVTRGTSPLCCVHDIWVDQADLANNAFLPQVVKHHIEKCLKQRGPIIEGVDSRSSPQNVIAVYCAETCERKLHAAGIPCATSDVLAFIDHFSRECSIETRDRTEFAPIIWQVFHPFFREVSYDVGGSPDLSLKDNNMKLLPTNLRPLFQKFIKHQLSEIENSLELGPLSEYCTQYVSRLRACYMRCDFDTAIFGGLRQWSLSELLYFVIFSSPRPCIVTGSLRHHEWNVLSGRIQDMWTFATTSLIPALRFVHKTVNKQSPRVMLIDGRTCARVREYMTYLRGKVIPEEESKGLTFSTLIPEAAVSLMWVVRCYQDLDRVLTAMTADMLFCKTIFTKAIMVEVSLEEYLTVCSGGTNRG